MNMPECTGRRLVAVGTSGAFTEERTYLIPIDSAAPSGRVIDLQLTKAPTMNINTNELPPGTTTTRSIDPCADLLDRAKDAVCGPRRGAYGEPEHNLKATADLWSTWINRRHKISLALTAADVATLMILLKAARLAETINHVDGCLDIAGYAACLHRCQRLDGAPAP